MSMAPDLGSGLERGDVDHKVQAALQELEHGDRMEGKRLTESATESVIHCPSISITEAVHMLNEVSRKYLVAEFYKEAKDLDDQIESYLDELSDLEDRCYIHKELEVRRRETKSTVVLNRSGGKTPQRSARSSPPRATSPLRKTSKSFATNEVRDWPSRSLSYNPQSPLLPYAIAPRKTAPKAGKAPKPSASLTETLENGTLRSTDEDEISTISGGSISQSKPLSEQRFALASIDLNTMEGKAHEWFRYLTSKTLPFIRGQNERFQKEPYQRVRIAVLDTGFAQDRLETQRFSGNVEKCFSCLPGDNNGYTDLEGHGTHVLFQLSRVCPNARLYSYRVAHRVDDHLCADKEAVLKALKMAVENEKVDVINMSFGWQFDDDDVEIALYEAQKAGVLLFASVGNFGALSSLNILYPASSPFVIAVDAADGLGEPASFNSSTETGQVKSRFTAPGSGVQGYNGSYVNGTSYASPIAAGIAALVLEFAKQTPLSGDAVLKYLRRFKGMSLIFNMMSVQKTTPKFKFLAPWELLCDDRQVFGGDGGPKSRRYHVSRVIVEELRRIYPDQAIGAKIAD